MPHSNTSYLIHYTFSTKGRQRIITNDIRDNLWAYMGGIARKNKMTCLIAGGAEDHAHVLVAIPSIMSPAKAVQLIKAGSSKWLREQSASHRDFRWQEGYGGFSIGVSQIDDTVRYIQNQMEHHKITTFENEYLAFLKRHNIEYDPMYVLD
ncbi:MAG: IS200/IS605 family transposase [Planctomycetaceae bacterium]|nr:MAG: IS200/IS605 family transposase [Planctomycetaceae bacterium]